MCVTPDWFANLRGQAVARFDGLALLVNSAGIFLAKPFTEYTAADYQALISTDDFWRSPPSWMARPRFSTTRWPTGESTPAPRWASRACR